MAIAVVCLLAVPFAFLGMAIAPTIALLIMLASVAAAESRPRAICTAGIVWSVIFVLLLVIAPHASRSSEVARSVICRDHLKNIYIALLNYQDVYGTPPPAYVTDDSGRPMHSWRVLILPFLDEPELYERYDFSKPWNDPHNRLLAEMRPELYACPSDRGGSSNTSYVAVVDANAPVRMKKATRHIVERKVSAESILIAEIVDSDIQWTEPRDMIAHESLIETLRADTYKRHRFVRPGFYDMSWVFVLTIDDTVSYVDGRPVLNQRKVIEAIILALTELFFVVACFALLRKANR